MLEEARDKFVFFLLVLLNYYRRRVGRKEINLSEEEGFLLVGSRYKKVEDDSFFFLFLCLKLDDD